MYFSTARSRGALAQITESCEVHTQRTMADGGERSPKRARNNPVVPGDGAGALRSAKGGPVSGYLAESGVGSVHQT